MALKFYTSVAKKLKLKAKKNWGLVLTLAEVTEEKLVGSLFAPPHSPEECEMAKILHGQILKPGIHKTPFLV